MCFALFGAILKCIVNTLKNFYFQLVRKVSSAYHATGKKIRYFVDKKEIIIGSHDAVYDLIEFRNEDEILSMSFDLRGLWREQSQWYGLVKQFKTISCDLRISRRPLTWRGTGRFLCVFPFRIIEQQNTIISIREELRYSVQDYYDITKLEASWLFDSSNSTSVCIHVSFRFSGLQEVKLRRIRLHEALKAAVDEAENRKATHISLIMRSIDVCQSGLHEIPTTAPKRTSSTINMEKLEFEVSELKKHVEYLNSIDELVLDILVFANDSHFLGNRGEKLNMSKIQKQNTLSKNRCIDPQYLASIIRSTDSGETGELLQTDVGRAVRRIMNFVNEKGYANEEPLKIVSQSHNMFNMYRTSRKDCTSYLTYFRTVRSVSDTGYRIKKTSWYMWIMFIIGFIIPVLYFIWRKKISESSVEDIVSAASSLAGIYIALASSFVFNTFYRGEQLIDVLSNMRNIDTQEEFSERGKHQIPDIIQVLRLSQRPPKFLGGNGRTCYVPSCFPGSGFDARTVMAFPNLSVIGYGLFEDEYGELFMIDPWDCVFEVFVVSQSASASAKIEERPNPNEYKKALKVSSDSRREIKDSEGQTQSNSSKCVIDLESPRESMTLFCKDLKATVTKWRPESDNNDTIHPDTGCLIVSYKSLESDVSVNVSRILPFRARCRRVGIVKERSVRCEFLWKLINNADLLAMNVGIEEKNNESSMET